MLIAWYHNIMCILSIISFILLWIAINSPSHGIPQYSLLSVTSGESGPNIWLGLGVSCVRLNKNTTTTCSDFAFDPKYNFSAISDAPVFVLEAPPGILRVLILFSAVLTTILMIFVVLGLILFKFFDNFEVYNKLLPYLVYFVPFIILIGALSFWASQMYFEKTALNFNEIAGLLGRSDLHATTGPGFLCAYIAYGLMVFPWLVAGLERDLRKDEPPKKEEPTEEKQPDSPPPPPPPTLVLDKIMSDPNFKSHASEHLRMIQNRIPPYNVLTEEDVDYIMREVEARGLKVDGQRKRDGDDNSVRGTSPGGTQPTGHANGTQPTGTNGTQPTTNGTQPPPNDNNVIGAIDSMATQEIYVAPPGK